MKKDTSSFQRREIKDVFDLNDIANEFCHAFPNRKKEREFMQKALQILHERLCNQQDANCWLCQKRWAEEMDNYFFNRPQKQECQSDVEPAYSNNGGYVMNDFINEHLRQKHCGEVRITPKSLASIWNNHIPDEHPGSDLSHCMYRLVERITDAFYDLPVSM